MSVHLASLWGELVLSGFAQGGVRRVVIAPGSRSTPFALAALRHPDLECHSVIDERSAAFFALGQARASGMPSLVIATSGTAGAHFFPALLEAAASSVPLLLLTADRPPELHDCGASQTLNQQHLFGTAPRHFVDLGPPRSEHTALVAVVRRAHRAALTAQGPLPGPVHVNAPVAKPLEPLSSNSSPLAPPTESAPILRQAAAAAAPPSLIAPPSSLEPLLHDLRHAERGLIVCGALDPSRSAPHEIAELARSTGFPLYAEAESQCRVSDKSVVLCHGLEAALRCPAFVDRFELDVVVQLGGAPLGPTWGQVFRQAARYHVVHPHAWADPARGGASVVVGELATTLRRLLSDIGALAPPRVAARAAFRRHMTDVNRIVEETIAAIVGEPTNGISEAAAVRGVAGQLPEGSPLVLGNSLPIREMNLFSPVWDCAHPVLSQRGVNGIDGLISSAAGVASVHGRATLLLGDISFLHDLGGLWVAAQTRGNVVIVVLNNCGGRIFEQLPIARATSNEEMAYWTTPHHLDLQHAAALFGTGYVSPRSVSELEAAITAAHQAEGCTIIDVPVPANDAHHTARQLEQTLTAKFATQLGGSQ